MPTPKGNRPKGIRIPHPTIRIPHPINIRGILVQQQLTSLIVRALLRSKPTISKDPKTGKIKESPMKVQWRPRGTKIFVNAYKAIFSGENAYKIPPEKGSLDIPLEEPIFIVDYAAGNAINHCIYNKTGKLRAVATDGEWQIFPVQ
ncbi:hypothetical protein KKE06_03445 [Candidatus Micrarchaeota archaeon]|nr:hypothetical protein [Candidatus Micrarchaeota archaeon]MBU1930567.1 hypothetical protein [Candidatus Micrarchaeota archaeon]